MAEALRIAVGEVQRRMDAGEHVVFLDSRTHEQWIGSTEKLPNAVRFPLNGMDTNVDALPRDATLIAYCT